jgi:hypothetical protein
VGRRREGKKKEIPVWEEDFLGSWPALLTMQWVAAVRCNLRLIWGSVFEFFPAPNNNCMAVIILARSSQNYPSVAPVSGSFLEPRSLGFLLVYPNHHLGSSSISYKYIKYINHIHLPPYPSVTLPLPQLSIP